MGMDAPLDESAVAGPSTIDAAPVSGSIVEHERRGTALAAVPSAPLSDRAIPMGYRPGIAAPILSILIPACNERATIRALLERVRSVPFPVPFELVVVDDGSKDGTREILNSLPAWENVRVVLHERNVGKGGAIQTAIQHARGEIVVIQDADLELDPLDLLPLLEVVYHRKSPVCFGSRFMGKTRHLWGMPTYWANRVLNSTCNVLNGIRITDMNTCYKMMRIDVARRISLTSRGFAMEPEITTKLARMGILIVERPISYQPRSKIDGKKIRWFDFFRFLIAMIRFRCSNQP